MKKLFIDYSKSPVDIFPKDDKLRVVWTYDAVYRNTGTTRVPEIYVMLREIELNSALSEKRKVFRKISVAKINSVRYMTFWKDNRRTIKAWKSFDGSYAENIQFSLGYLLSYFYKLYRKKEQILNIVISRHIDIKLTT